MTRGTWRVLAIGLVTAFVAVLAGCGGDDKGTDSGAKSDGAGSSGAVRVALVLPCATSDPWCKQGNDAAKKLESEGAIDLKITPGAPQDTAGASQVIRQHAQDRQLVLAYSTWQDAVVPVAEKFPDVGFATFGSEATDNMALFDEPIYQGAYLAGILAGGITKTNIISGVAGQDVPLCHAEMVAFEKGAQSVNPKVKQLTTYVGDWNDPAKSQQAVLAQVDQKSDVVLACGGAQATGMAQVIKERNVSGFGYVGDTSAQAPKNFVGTVIYDPYPYIKAMADDVKAGSFKPAKTYSFGLPEGGVRLDLNADYGVTEIPADIKAKMEEVQQKIMDGEFEVPYEPAAK